MNGDQWPEMSSLYPALLDVHLAGEFAVLDESLNPRPPEAILNIAGEAGLDQGMLVVDVGCGRGDHLALLARRHGCRALGVDLAPGNLHLALADQRPEETAYFGQANVEALPLADRAVDLVLCRDMLLHVADLERGVAECSRVLQPGGNMIVLATVISEYLNLDEAVSLFKPLGIVPKNLIRSWLESSFATAGLAIQRAEVTGGERLEYLEEQGGYYSRELMRLARLRREPERYRRQLGPERYRLALGLYTFSVYLLTGKLVDIVYWLKK